MIPVAETEEQLLPVWVRHEALLVVTESISLCRK